MVVSSGIPLTACFLAKFYIVAAGADSQAWLLILVLVVTSAIGLFYYLRVITTLFISQSRKARHMNLPRATRRPYRSSWRCSQHLWFGSESFPHHCFA